jgi:hypothetical protein
MNFYDNTPALNFPVKELTVKREIFNSGRVAESVREIYFFICRS